MWRQAAELVYDIVLKLDDICFNEVEKRFKETTWKNLEEWNPWFERMVDLATKKRWRKKHNIFLTSVSFPYSSIINNNIIYLADPDNRCMVNEAHALFRAHLMLSIVDVITTTRDNVRKQKIRNFLKTHFNWKTFNIFKT